MRNLEIISNIFHVVEIKHRNGTLYGTIVSLVGEYSVKINRS